MNRNTSAKRVTKHIIYLLDSFRIDFFAEDQKSFRFSFYITLKEPQRIKLEFQILWDKELCEETRPIPIIDSQMNQDRMYFEILHTLKSPGPTTFPLGNHKLMLLLNGKAACVTGFSPKPASSFSK